MWKRIAVIAAGPAVNLVLAFVLLFVFFWAIGPAGVSNKVGATERAYPAHAALKPGDKLISVDGQRGARTAWRGSSPATSARASP